MNNTTTSANRTDPNLTERITKFQNQLKSNFVYRIPLKFLCDIGLVNQCFKFNKKFTLTLQTEMQKLFETNLTASNLPTSVDAEIIFNSAPYIQYDQIKLDDSFKKYLEGTLISEHVLRTEIKPIPYLKTYEIVRGSQSHIVNFRGANKQFSFLEISLVYNKNDQHKTVYDSYDVEVAFTKIKSLKLENASSTYSAFNSVKFDLEDYYDKYLL